MSKEDIKQLQKWIIGTIEKLDFLCTIWTDKKQTRFASYIILEQKDFEYLKKQQQTDNKKCLKMSIMPDSLD